MDFLQVGGWVLTATATVLSIIKFKLIEELVKKIGSDDSKATLYSVLLVFGMIIILSVLTLNVSTPQSDPQQPVAENPVDTLNEDVDDQTSTENPSEEEKTDLEVKVAVAKDVLSTGKELVKEIKDTKRKNDSLFQSYLGERWVYKIGDWTDEDSRILETYKKLKLSMVRNIKLFKQRKRYIVIVEDHFNREQLEESLDSLRTELAGLSIDIFDLNSQIKNRRQEIVEREETFGKRKDKIRLECLVVD